MALRVATLACSLLATAGEDSYFILGYGSLMKEWSRIRTKCGMVSNSESALMGMDEFIDETTEAHTCVEDAQSDKLIPVQLTGVRRGWYSRGKLQSASVDKVNDSVKLLYNWATQKFDIAPTYLGAVEDKDSSCFATIYPVNADELNRSDERETMGTYSPGWIDTANLKSLDANYTLPAGAKIRWYPMNESDAKEPNAQFPIVQSYVDIFIGGAYELEKKYNVPGFAKNVAATTYAWSSNWINDRKVPYRPFINDKLSFAVVKTLLEATQIDNSLLTIDHLAGVTFPAQPVPAPPPTTVATTTAAPGTPWWRSPWLWIGILVGLLAVIAAICFCCNSGHDNGSSSELSDQEGSETDRIIDGED